MRWLLRLEYRMNEYLKINFKIKRNEKLLYGVSISYFFFI